jgi:hypothetical protein
MLPIFISKEYWHVYCALFGPQVKLFEHQRNSQFHCSFFVFDAWKIQRTLSVLGLSDALGTCLDLAKHGVLASEEVRRTGMPLPLRSSHARSNGRTRLGPTPNRASPRSLNQRTRALWLSEPPALAHAHLGTTPVTSRDESLSCLETPSAPFNRG